MHVCSVAGVGANGTSAQPLTVGVFAEVIGVHSKTAAHGGVFEHARRPRKAYAWEEDIVNGLLQSGSPNLTTKPHGALGPVESIGEGGIEAPNCVVQLAHAGGRFIAQAQVDGQIGLNLEIILHKDLRIFYAHVSYGLVGGLPVLNVAQQEVRKACAARSTGGRTGGAILLCILASKGKLPGVYVAPRGGVTFPHQYFRTEMQNVLAFD